MASDALKNYRNLQIAIFGDEILNTSQVVYYGGSGGKWHVWWQE